MKRVFLALIVMVLFSMTGYTQQTAVKLGLGGLAVTNLNLRLEQAISDRASIQLSFGYKLPSNIDRFFENSDGINDLDISYGDFRGFSVLPELRFYFGKSMAGTIEGFYLAPYLKFQRYQFGESQVINYQSGNDLIVLNPDLNIRFGAIGGGLQLGYHFILGKNFSIDWHFLGFGIDAHRFRLTYDFRNSNVDLLDVADQVIMDINNELEEDLPFTAQDIAPLVDGNRLRFGFPFTLPAFRTGISIGFAF